MANSYWESITRSRLSRRRALVATSSAAAAAAFLAACGGGDSGGGESGGAKKDSSGLIFEPTDSTAQAKPGGTLKSFAAADITTFDNLANNGSPPLSMSAIYAYPRLVKYKKAQYPKEYDGSFEGDLGESWEVSPDKLTLTFKIRQGVKWDPRPPTNGRLADSNDVLESWKKFIGINPGAATYAYNAQTAPSSPVESLTAPDARTIVIKLKEPDSSIIPLFAGTTFSPHPVEGTNGGFDPRNTVRGHGPYTLEEYTPSSRFVWKRNPDYYVKGRPYPERIEVPIVPEYATRLSQFKAGNIHLDVMGAFGGGQADIVPAKKDQPELLLAKAPFYPTQAAWGFYFGWDGNAPFKDQRLRQAASMLIDREGYINVIDNRDGFAKEGLDLDAAYGTVVAAGWTGYWLDPQNEKEFGPSAKYMKYDMAEAKKLIAAAGNVPEFDLHINASGTFPVQTKAAELFTAMFLDGGLKPKVNAVTNAVQYQDDYYYGYKNPEYGAGTKKGYGGIAMGQERPFATIPLLIFGTLHKDGAFYKGISPTGTNVKDGDPRLNDMAVKIKGEFDVPKQQGLTHELIKYFTDKMYFVPQVSQAKAFSVWWPCIGNLNVFSTGTSPNTYTESRIDWWVDETKPPFKKA